MFIPAWNCRSSAPRLFTDAHKWKEARAEFEKLLTMLKDPANPRASARSFALRSAAFS